MQTTKLVVTVAGNLEKKYGKAGRRKIDQAIASLIAKDRTREMATRYVHLDVAADVKPHGLKPVKGMATAAKCKRLIDALFRKLTPDYLVLLGAGDVVPYFLVVNPSRNDGGDDDQQVPTDNPYACSRPFRARQRASYLIPDRVVGRVPDLLGGSDPRWLLDYLKVAENWKLGATKDFADDLLVCCQAWKGSGEECVRYLERATKRLMISPPTKASSTPLRTHLGSRFHLIKCHGAPIDASFYGQKGEAYPTALLSTVVKGRTKPGTIVGAMCCYGASVFDPSDPAAVVPGAPPIPSMYLRQGAYGFMGSTTIAWVGSDQMLGADWVVSSYLRNLMRGASLGRALVDAKQDFVSWINQQGLKPDLADEKTLLQFHLLGDPAIHLVPVAGAAQAVPAMAKVAAAAGVMGRPDDRRARRLVRAATGERLRQALPQRRRTQRRAAANVKRVFTQLRSHARMQHVRFGAPIVEEVRRRPPAMPPAVRGAEQRALTAAVAGARTIEYYWVGKRKRDRVIDARLVKIEADPQGRVIRTKVLVSS